jgi:hypothetical protein
MIVRVAWAGGVEKTKRTFAHEWLDLMIWRCKDRTVFTSAGKLWTNHLFIIKIIFYFFARCNFIRKVVSSHHATHQNVHNFAQKYLAGAVILLNTHTFHHPTRPH